VPSSSLTPEILFVQELWTAFDEDGVAAVVERADPDVDWQPVLSEGRSMLGPEAAEFFATRAREGVTVQAKPYRYEQLGSCVIVTGSLRIREHGGFSEKSRVWVFRFDAGRLVGMAGFATHADALASCDG
jgi:hypothetical protein